MSPTSSAPASPTAGGAPVPAGADAEGSLARGPALARVLPLLALCLALAFGLRALGLADFTLTHWDEGLAWRGARWFASAGAQGHYSPTHAPPLASLSFGLAALLGGRGPASAVWVDVLAGSLAVLAAYKLATEVAGRLAGLLAAGLLALSPLHVMYSRTLLTESLYALFLLATLAFAASAFRTGRLRTYWLAGLCGAALQGTKYNGFLTPACVLILLAFRSRKEASGARTVASRGLALLAPTAAVMLANVGLLALSGTLGAFFRHYARYVGEPAAPLQMLETFTWLCVDPFTLGLAMLGLVAGLLAGPRRLGSPGLLLAGASFLYALFALNYSLYLRLLLPLASLMLVAAAVAVGLVARRSKPAGLLLATLLLALQAHGLWRPALPVATNAGFGGYARTEEALDLATREPVPLFSTQAFVWSEATTRRDGREVIVASPASSQARAYLERLGSQPVLFLWDIGAFSRQRDWTLAQVHDRLRELPGYRRFENPLNLDCLQNNLSLDELRALEDSSELRERVLGIHSVTLPASQLLAWTRAVAGPRTAGGDGGASGDGGKAGADH